jgi:DNA-binding transcriptional regulator YhcF (GntR family)
MNAPSESQVAARLSELLAEPLGPRSLKEIRSSSGHPKSDFTLRVGSYKFVIECRHSGATDSVVSAIGQLAEYAKNSRGGVIPILVVPFMGEVGKHLCKEAGVGWADLSGNADLVAPGLKIHIEGRPNLFKQSGRPGDVFAPNSSRITRSLLANYVSAFSEEGLERRTSLGSRTVRGNDPGVRELADKTKADVGLTSRVLSRLEAQGFVSRHTVGRTVVVRLRNPDLLLEAWRVQYKFFRHRIIPGHVAARTGEDLVRDLAKKLKSAGVGYAATGLSAAWLFTHFVRFRLVTFFLRKEPGESLLSDIGFRRDPKGANVWLVVPNDVGVFQEMRTPQDYGNLNEDEKDIQCVHPVQVYVDLKDHPERSAEAAQELRNRLLRWGRNG